MKSNSYSSEEDDGDFNDDVSDEEDYDLINEEEQINTTLIEPSDQLKEEILSHDELPPKTDKTIFDLADESDSDEEDFQINHDSSSITESSENDIGTFANDGIAEEKKETKSNQNLVEKDTNNTNQLLSKLNELDSESDEDDFEETFKGNSYENTETDTEYSDIEKLKKKLKSKQKGDSKGIDELKMLLNTIVTLIIPYNNASEALNNSLDDDQKAQKITDAATKLLFLGKYNIYSCNIEQLKSELNDLQKDA